MYARLAEPYLVASRCDRMKKIWLNTRKNKFQSNKNYAHSVLIYPWIPVIPWYGYTVCHGVPNTKTVPVPVVPVTRSPRVFPYPWRTLQIIYFNIPRDIDHIRLLNLSWWDSIAFLYSRGFRIALWTILTRHLMFIPNIHPSDRGWCPVGPECASGSVGMNSDICSKLIWGSVESWHDSIGWSGRWMSSDSLLWIRLKSNGKQIFNYSQCDPFICTLQQIRKLGPYIMV
jgi:hypothetical protein